MGDLGVVEEAGELDVDAIRAEAEATLAPTFAPIYGLAAARILARRALALVAEREALLAERDAAVRAAYECAREDAADTLALLERAETAEMELTQAHANIDQLLGESKRNEGLLERVRQLEETNAGGGAAACSGGDS